MIAAYFFVITLLAPVYDAQIEVTITASTEGACWKARRAAQTMLRDVKARVTECAEKK